MSKLLKKPNVFNALGWKRPLRRLATVVLLLLAILAACSQKPETITVEVTRVVTETVVREDEEIVVTRVVTETVLETVEIAPEEETDGDLPSATGSEGDAEPLPPPPDDGPKVTERRGPTIVAALAMETAVTLRAAQTNATTTVTTQLRHTTIPPTELLKWCHHVAKSHKKRCN